MNVTIKMFLLMLCVVCSLDAGRFKLVANAQPTVKATILTPPLDRREGGQVDMKCAATNLEPDHAVEWRINDHIYTALRWDDFTETPRPRYHYTTLKTHGETIQDLTITNLQRNDTNEYVCNVRDPAPTGEFMVVASERVRLSVLDGNFKFPNDSFPMCSPDGPVTVEPGTKLLCLSRGTNSEVMMEVSEIPPASSNSFIWTSSKTTDTLSMSLDITDDAHDCVSFHCVISSVPYPDVRRSCTIGPISVRDVTQPKTEPATKPSAQPPTYNQTRDKLCTGTSLPLFAAFVVSITLLAASFTAIIFLVRRIVHQKQLIIKLLAEREPGMELQPGVEQNADHAYCPPVQEENDNPGYDHFINPQDD